MITVRSILGIAFVWMACAGPAQTHEFWIDADQYQLDSDTQVVARFRNGETYRGTELAFFPNRTGQLAIVMNDVRTDIAPRMGDRPAISIPAPGDGLAVLIHETTPAIVAYKAWEDFAAFAAHKDFPDIRARHEARGLPLQDFRETYTRHAKALIAIGAGVGSDGVTGMQTEFVARANPYTEDLAAGLPVQLYYQGAPRSDAQVEIFDRAPDGAVTVTTTRTDAAGRATIRVLSGHTYLLDAVVLREASGEGVWHTLWASLTFAVP